MGGMDSLRAQRLSDIPVRSVQWLIPGLVPLGAITLLVGEPGHGKSLLTAHWAAEVTTGATPGHAIFAAGEDSVSAVLRPRLEAAGADVSRVLVAGQGDDPPMQLPRDVPALREM